MTASIIYNIKMNYSLDVYVRYIQHCETINLKLNTKFLFLEKNESFIMINYFEHGRLIVFSRDV